MKYLNLGCGSRFHPGWTNVDFTSVASEVMAYNLTRGIPFPDISFDTVYHSHLLEHLPKSKAPIFLHECYRVLRPQGIIRIAVPDLEQIVRGYILALEQAMASFPEAIDNYNWLLLELFDQIVRTRSGGDMATYLFQQNIPNQDFIIKRLGIEAQKLITEGRNQRQITSLRKSWLKRAFKATYQFLRNPAFRRNVFLKLVLRSEDYQALQVGRFRQSGEVHQWMYDRYSLTTLLQDTGFTQIIQRTATESYIPCWSSFNLDTESDGRIYKPDSLYMEAIKPAET